MPMVNMKVSREKEEEIQSESPEQEYPFGLRLWMNDDTLKKLGIKDLPEVGKEFGVEARAKVAEVSEVASESNEEKRMELQITDLNLVDPDASRAERLFSGNAQSE